MSRVQIDFSKIAAQDLSGPARPRATALPSTSEFASLLDAGHDGSTTSAHADTRFARSSRYDEGLSSRADSSPPGDRLTPADRLPSGRIERADAASNGKDESQQRAADRAETATATEKNSAPHEVADTRGESDLGASSAETDQGDGMTDAGNGAVTATVAVPEIVLASAAPVVQPSAPTFDGATSDGATSVGVAAATVTALSSVQSSDADTVHAEAKKDQITEDSRPAITAPGAGLAYKKPGGETVAVDDESVPPEAAEADSASESLSTAAKPAEGGKLRTAGAASATAPAGERPSADEQQVPPLPLDASDGGKTHLTTATVPEEAQAHVHASMDKENVAGKPQEKGAGGDGAAVRTNEPPIGALQAAAAADSAPSITSVGAHAGIGAIGSASAGASSTAAAPLASRTDAATTAVPLTDLGVEIATQAKGGRRSFDIRLDPAELGHIHVRLDVDRDGNVVSRLVVDRAETLDLLRRDAPQLERALQDAGLKADAQTMQFSLRHQNSGQQDGQNTQRSATPTADSGARPDEVPLSYGRLPSRAGGLDIRI